MFNISVCVLFRTFRVSKAGFSYGGSVWILLWSAAGTNMCPTMVSDYEHEIVGVCVEFSIVACYITQNTHLWLMYHRF
jgi:hypothetical protein